MKEKPKVRLNAAIFTLTVILTILFTAGVNYSNSNLHDSKIVRDSVIYQHGCMHSDKMCTKEECGMENCRPEGGACKEECMKDMEMHKHHNDQEMKHDENKQDNKDGEHKDHNQKDGDSQHNHGCHKH